MQHGSKTLSSFGGSVESSRGVGTATKAHGSWRLWAHGPLLVGDPDKFLSLVGEHSHFISSPDLLQLGRIHLSTWERLRSHLQSIGSPVLTEVERMLGGGLLKWEAAIENLVVNQGLDDVLDKYFKASAYTASHFVGLTDSTKGGTVGTLYSVGAFSGGDKSLGSGDSLSVQGTLTQADDGV